METQILLDRTNCKDRCVTRKSILAKILNKHPDALAAALAWRYTQCTCKPEQQKVPVGWDFPPRIVKPAA